MFIVHYLIVKGLRWSLRKKFEREKCQEGREKAKKALRASDIVRRIWGSVCPMPDLVCSDIACTIGTSTANYSPIASDLTKKCFGSPHLGVTSSPVTVCHLSISKYTAPSTTSDNSLRPSTSAEASALFGPCPTHLGEGLPSSDLLHPHLEKRLCPIWTSSSRASSQIVVVDVARRFWESVCPIRISSAASGSFAQFGSLPAAPRRDGRERSPRSIQSVEISHGGRNRPCKLEGRGGSFQAGKEG